jgi:uncharacterized protein
MKIARNARRNAVIGLLACLSVALASAFAFAHERVPIPDLHARVTDLTQTLTSEQTAALDGELAALEARKGAQLALLMIPTLTPPADVPTQAEDIESYATRVFEQWKLGRKRVDDGVLLIVIKNDHKVRIEVGYGLEGAIPDAAAARIIREYIAPRFRENDYYGGIHAATAVLTQLIEGEPLPAPLEGARHAQTATALDDGPSDIAVFFSSLLLGLVLALSLENLLNFFPIRVIPIGARRVVGLLGGPAILAALYYLWGPLWGTSGPHLATSQLAIAAVASGALGGYVVPQGASKVWAGGMTWRGFFDFKSWPATIAEFVICGVVGAFLGVSISGGGGGGSFSGGGGKSGGGGASGSW